MIYSVKIVCKIVPVLKLEESQYMIEAITMNNQ